MTTKTLFKPAKETPFVIEAEKFFHTMFYMDFPASVDHILGGNITGLLWRFDDEPNAWRITYRFRYYKGTQISAVESKDEFSWYTAHIDGTRCVIEKALDKFLETLGLAHMVHFESMSQPVHRFEIKGDSDRFLHLIQNTPPFWMHTRPAEAHEHP